jgi:hypothetical protein
MPVMSPVYNRVRVLAVAALLGIIAVALPLAAPGGHTHHDKGQGLYDGQCPLLALDGLRIVAHASGAPESTDLVLVATARIAVAPDGPSTAPARQSDPRAPPLA